MRIVSDFHDYYGTVQATGQDQTVVYLRTKKEVKLNRNSFPFPVFEGTRWPLDHPLQEGVPVVQSVVGFCGKVYPILRLSHQRQSGKAPMSLCAIRLRRWTPSLSIIASSARSRPIGRNLVGGDLGTIGPGTKGGRSSRSSSTATLRNKQPSVSCFWTAEAQFLWPQRGAVPADRTVSTRSCTTTA